MFVVGGDEPQLCVGIQAEVHGVCSLHHGGQGDSMVPSVDAPLLGIDNDGHAVVANHAACVVGREFPDGQLSAVLVHPQHGPNHVTRTVGLDPRKQRVERPVGVPQAEHGVVVAFVVRQRVNAQIGPAVSAIHVACEVGHRGGVVQRRVKGGSLV